MLGNVLLENASPLVEKYAVSALLRVMVPQSFPCPIFLGNVWSVLAPTTKVLVIRDLSLSTQVTLRRTPWNSILNPRGGGGTGTLDWKPLALNNIIRSSFKLIPWKLKRERLHYSGNWANKILHATWKSIIVYPDGWVNYSFACFCFRDDVWTIVKRK